MRRLNTLAVAAFGAALAGLAACAGGPSPQFGSAAYDWRLPEWVPPPVVPADNPMSEAKFELGRHLFYDTRQSADNTQACATCHHQDRAFTDGRALPVGVTGDVVARNAQGLANVAWLPVLTWANPNVKSLEQQALIPIFGTHPAELGMAGREDELFARLRAEPRYRPLFAAAFPESPDEISLRTITRALAAFQRGIVSYRAPYDRYKWGGDADAISASAKRGEDLFFGERLECYHCHGGFTFTDNIRHARLPFAELGFHNTALYDADGEGGYPADNPGIVEHTGDPDDRGRFRTPSLRNVEVTAPYMHDGSIETLDAAIDHYAAGGRKPGNPLKSNFLVGFELSAQERGDLIAFLKSLTDRSLLTDPRYADPWNGSASPRTKQEIR
jgi:cytochrome c peroxidase